MIPRRNKSGSWKLRVRVDQGRKKVKRLIEMGLGTEDYHEACTRAYYTLKLGVIANITHQQGITLSDAGSPTQARITFDTREQLHQATLKHERPTEPSRP